MTTSLILAILAGNRSIPATAHTAGITQNQLANILDTLTTTQETEFSRYIHQTEQKAIA